MDNSDVAQTHLAGSPDLQAPAKPADLSHSESDTEVSDDELIARHLGTSPNTLSLHSERAFETLYQRHKDSLYRFFLRQLSHAEANDAYQETWTKLVDALPQYTAKDRFRSFLFSIAHNVLTDHHRKQMRTPEQTDEQATLDSTAAPASSADEALSGQEMREHLYTAIRKLPLNQRTVWLLKQETDLSLQEIAELTRTSLEGTRSRLRYARETLKAGMQRYVRL